MRLKEIWRTSTFRLSVLYGALFALATVALLGMIYLQSAVYLTRRVDSILETEAHALAAAPGASLRQRIDDALALNGGRNRIFAVFRPDGGYVTGNLRHLPAHLEAGGKPIEIPPAPGTVAITRLIARKLPSGETLVVGRDVSQLSEMRRIIGSALVWSGSLILLVGLGCGAALSLAPLRRLQRMQVIGHDIAGGNLSRRMPVSARGDELDMFAETVNHMISEVERLMAQTKASTDIIAHDLRTPLTRARAHLERLGQAQGGDRHEVAHVTDQLDQVLDRFRAILRISEIEARARRAGFAIIDLGAVLRTAADLYTPLAEEDGVGFALEAGRGRFIEADPKLLFEAISNLLDNAIKFTPRGGHVRVRLEDGGERYRIVVRDDGPGVPTSELSSVLERFYRRDRDRLAPGSGLGLSIVAAIMRLHEFELTLEDAAPGLRVVIAAPKAMQPSDKTDDLSFRP
ncbi:MAG TPA: ATP-binding protein [Phenylobacterium sp.]|uniref:sensor histidine kinase n=1 Tax=Phenylobacterium sp. TaxID=1871053 RepID=UPI002B474866|nr:ATP-binding protein [Phenylobacterium sp.]HKR87609.1 ATP-binding protein [Phenylobacterium sp.]